MVRPARFRELTIDGGKPMVDMVIIGKGPAGWSCAITARLRGLSVILIAPPDDTGWLKKAERIDNYPGLPQVSGRKLLDSFAQQAVDLGAEDRVGLVRQILPSGKGFMLLVENDVIECKTVVLAMGAARSTLLYGEEEQIGHGVSYCATCDGMLYRGKRIAVLSTSLQGVEESEFLAKLVSELDYYSLKKHDTQRLPESARVIPEKPVAIGRQEQQLLVVTAAGSHAYDGIFVFRSAMPLNMLIAELKTEGSFIPVDRSMRTNVAGVFAAGDCTGKPLQIAKAVGEGNIAAISAAEYISENG